MPTNAEESEKASSGTSNNQNEPVGSPNVHTSVSTNSLDVSNLPASIKSSDVWKDTNSPETSPSVETSECKTTSGGLQENEERHSSPDEGLKVFSTDENSVSGLDATPLCETAETKLLSESTSKGNKQSRDGEESDLQVSAGPTRVGGVTNEASQLDEINQTEHDVQIQVVSPTAATVHSQKVLVGWDVMRSWSLMVLLAAVILWAAIFFPLLLNGII